MNMLPYDFILNGHQRIVESVGVPGATANSKIFATVAEWDQGNRRTFIGAARVYLCNLSVVEGGINIWIQVDWDNDILIHVDLLIVN